jgi:hypothetical protein
MVRRARQPAYHGASWYLQRVGRLPISDTYSFSVTRISKSNNEAVQRFVPVCHLREEPSLMQWNVSRYLAYVGKVDFCNVG